MRTETRQNPHTRSSTTLIHRALPSLSFSSLPSPASVCPHRLAALLGMLADSMAEMEQEEGEQAEFAAVAGAHPRRAAFLTASAAEPASEPSSADPAFLALCAASGAGFLALVASLRRAVRACRRTEEEVVVPPSLLEPLSPGEVAGAGEAVENPAFFGKV